MDLYMGRRETAEYSVFKNRVRKTTYQSKNLKLDRPSLAMTEFAVDYLRELAPRELGRIDMYWASSMCRDTYVSPCTLMVALMYAKRLKTENSKYLETVHSSNLLLVSMMVASKFFIEVDDTTLEEWMKASNMDSDDLYELEIDFLQAIGWNLFVTTNDFGLFLLQLEQRIAWRQYLQRSDKFFTYTDLQVLSQSRDGLIWNSFVNMCLDIVKIVGLCTATYAVAIITLASIPLLTRTTSTEDIGNHPGPQDVRTVFESHPEIQGNIGVMLGVDKISHEEEELSGPIEGGLKGRLNNGCHFLCREKICLESDENNSSSISEKNYSKVESIQEIMGLFPVPFSSLFHLSFPETQSLS